MIFQAKRQIRMTDELSPVQYAHVKWGVRHVAGKKYAHGGGRR